MLIFHRRQVEGVLAEYLAHYNGHLPHQARDQQPPAALDEPLPTGEPELAQLRRHGRPLAPFTSTSSAHELP